MPFDVQELSWRERRQLAYQFMDFRDINLPHEYFNKSDDAVIDMIVEFFEKGSKLIYPAKSYFVAIVYAKCLEKFFQVPFYSALCEFDLLPDDSYYCSYLIKPSIYNKVLDRIGDIWSYDSILPTVSYFKEEFLLDV